MRHWLTGRDILSVNQFSKFDILYILNIARHLKRHAHPRLLEHRLLGSCFFEPSTRTRLSFEAAMQRLGGQVVGFADAMATSVKKGETLSDTIKIIGQYVDVLVVRHPENGAAESATRATDKPVINGGDGTNEHPTQTLLDLFTIQEVRGTLDGISIALVGDLKHGRTVHSLVKTLGHFRPWVHLVSPPGLGMPETIINEMRTRGVRFSFGRTIEEVLPKIDILYMTRLQQERFANPRDYEAVKNSFVLTAAMLERAPERLRVLHPLPRVNEIATEVDATPFAYYFQQAQNGLYVRQALLALILGKV